MGTNKLDEMQLQIRNKVGTESFFLLCFLITIDVILYGLGIRWMDYPVNTFVIMLLCLTYYSVRLFLRGAYIRTTENKGKEAAKKVISSIICMAISAIIAVAAIKSKLIKVTGTSNQNNGAKFLLIASVCMLIVQLTFMVIANKKYDKDQE